MSAADTDPTLPGVCPRCLGSHAEDDAETGERLPCTACFGMSRRPTEGELRAEVLRLRGQLAACVDALGVVVPPDATPADAIVDEYQRATGEARALRLARDAAETETARVRELFAESADAFDGLVLKAWRAATGDTHEGPASVDDLLAALRKVRAERNVAFAAGVDAARSMCADYCDARAEALDAAAGEDPEPDDPEVAENFGRFCEAHELSTALRVLQRPDMEEVLRAVDTRVATARREGAEAMREACARVADELAELYAEAAAEKAARRIRALPLPEVTP